MKKLADQIKQALNGLAFADIGERIGRREQYAALFPGDAPAARTSTPVVSRKWIALGVGDTLPPHVMGYVIGACRRMQADLLLISVDAMQVRSLLADYLPDLHGIGCQTEELASASAANVVQALDRHRGVLFAVSSADNDPLRPLLRARRSLRSPVPVPVVLVSPKTASAPAASRAKAASA
ncbi:MAG: hypothetical protein Q8Q28_05490 [Pseudomonadota bacterium]|nr:hypothetical protein [Pseudomonadota bacterium]